MKAVRFTLAEARAVRDLVEAAAREEADKVWDRVLTKLWAAEMEPASVNAAPLESVLIESSRGRVVALGATGPVWARASRSAATVGATAEDASVLGAWLGRQGWLRGSLTLLDVLRKWPEWLAKAKAEAAPVGAPEGFNGNAGRGTEAQRGPAAARRRPAPIG